MSADFDSRMEARRRCANRAGALVPSARLASAKAVVARMAFALAALGGAVAVTGCGTAKPEPALAVVPSVDFQKYAGTWYEIARYPIDQQKDCTNTTATYTPEDDGDVQVKNRCIKPDGTVDEATARAFVPNKEEPAKLKVEFFPIVGRGDYWIIGLDPNYQWAVVGHPSREYLWILSRAKTLDQTILDDIFARLREQQYDPSKLVFTKHD